MLRVIADIVAPSLLKETKDEEQRVRVFRIEGLSGPDYLNSAKTAAGVPQMGNGYPPGRGYSGAVVNRDFRHPKNRRDVVIATITYSNKATPNDGGSSGGQQQDAKPKVISVSVNSVLVPVTTELDFEGRPMYVAYSPQFGTSQQQTTSSDSEGGTQVLNVEKQADVEFSLCRFQDFDACKRAEIVLEEPWNPWTSDNFINTTNRKEFWGKKPGTLWIENIIGLTEVDADGRLRAKKTRMWQNKYIILHNPKGFLKLGKAEFPRMKPGQIPANCNLPKKVNLATRDKDSSDSADPRLKAGYESGNGWGIFRIKGESDFANLIDQKLIDLSI